MRYLHLIALTLAIAGCSQGLPITTPLVEVSMTGAGAMPQVRRLDVVEIRSVQGSAFRQNEFGGAQCQITGTGFRAAFTTPARLRLPVYDGRTDAVSLTCTARFAQGMITRSDVIEAKNLTADAVDEGITIGIGTGGTSIRAAISLRDRSKDRFDYPSRFTVRF